MVWPIVVAKIQFIVVVYNLTRACVAVAVGIDLLRSDQKS